jgi:hypothetical protein
MTEELQPGFEVLPQPPKRGHGKLIASIVAVVVLGAGAAISYVAFAADSGGSSSPDKAVQKVVDDLQHSDVVGVLDDLVPGERDALSGAVDADVTALKRLGVLSTNADPKAISGVHFVAHNLTYADKTITVNDHVQIVQITGGTIDVTGNAAQLPFTQRFLNTTHVPDKNNHAHVTIDHPVRIATEKVGGGWYASLFYTAADSAAHHEIPTAADRIPAVGADSPEDAVGKVVRSAMSGDLRSVLAVVSPDELGALHDYGGMLLKNAPQPHALPVTLKKLDFTTTPITNGMRVSLKHVTLTAQGQAISVSIDKDCATVDAGALHKTVCAKDAANLIGGALGGLGCAGFAPMSNGSVPPSGCQGPQFTAAQKRAITDLLKGLLSTGGVDTAQVNGSWYVTPVRTLADLSSNVLGALQGDDLYQLATLGH